MFLLDTNILSELPRPKPDENLLAWFDLLPEFALSAITVEELGYGVSRATGRNAVRLREWFEALLAIPPLIVPVDEVVARAASELRAARDRRGLPSAQADMIIAATALISGFTLATRNVDDFENCGIAIINPFRG